MLDSYSAIRVNVTYKDDSEFPADITYSWVGESNLIAISSDFLNMAIGHIYTVAIDGSQIVVGGFCLEYCHGDDKVLIFKRVGKIGPWVSKIGIMNPLIEGINVNK